MKSVLSPLLSFNAGYVDTAGFMALSGLFTAHVTGNFVTFGAAAAQGPTGVSTKLLVLPVFCVVVVAARLLAHPLQRQGKPVLRLLLATKFVLLALAAGSAVFGAPFTGPDRGFALITGLTLAAAMAIQNAAHRMYMTSEPPTTLMTGTTTQIMIDLADLIAGVTEDAKPALLGRLKRMAASLLTFAIGCGTGAFVWVAGAEWCFLLPPLVAFASPFLAPSS